MASPGPITVLRVRVGGCSILTLSTREGEGIVKRLQEHYGTRLSEEDFDKLLKGRVLEAVESPKVGIAWWEQSVKQFDCFIRVNGSITVAYCSPYVSKSGNELS